MNKKRVSKNEKDVEKVGYSISPIELLKDEKEHMQDPSVSKRARTRWFLAYTLVHNPVVSKVIHFIRRNLTPP